MTKDDLILNMTPENRTKIFGIRQKLDFYNLVIQCETECSQQETGLPDSMSTWNKAQIKSTYPVRKKT